MATDYTEAEQYLQRLVRRHLKRVQYPDPNPLAPVDRNTVMEADERTESNRLQILMIGLELDHDVVLARLLQAAISVREQFELGMDGDGEVRGESAGTGESGDERDADEEDDQDEDAIRTVAAINKFLELAVEHYSHVRIKEVICFLQNILEQLMQKEEDADNGNDDDTDETDDSVYMDDWSETPIYESDVTILIGESTILVGFTDILSCFWSPTDLDTPCHHCANPFVGEPPIRTFNIISDDPAPMRVRLFNRHFHCIQRDSIFFVPVSHVWDDSIRRANADRVHSNAAASQLIKTLEALFAGAEDAYEAGVEFWHDYFSVPQWQNDVKEQLLMRLPAIYHVADEILVHMADLCPSYVSLLLVGAGTTPANSNDPLLRATGKIPLVRAVCGSDWMSRLWVTLEYAQCRAACVMDKRGTIHRFREYDGETTSPIVALFARDTFSRIVHSAHNQLLELFRYANSFAKSLSQPGEFLGGIAATENGGNQNRRLCLGQAVELVILKGCQFPRDRLIVLDILLDGQQTGWWTEEGRVSTLPAAEREACAHVWRKALEQGDYSPLLLQPRERVPESNPQPELASWLVGHPVLEGAEWGCGNQLEAPQYPAILRDDRGIRVQLQLVGRIETIHYLDVEMSGEIAGVDWAIAILDDIARASDYITGTGLSPRDLVDGLSRVFPFDEIHKKLARHIVSMPFTFEEIQDQDPEFGERIQDCLDRYRDGREGVAQEISDALALETNVAGDLSNDITRLTRSRHLARHRKSRGGSIGGEPVCLVRCGGCDRVTPFRLDLRDTGRTGHLVYRIPGLAYADTVRDGVGLVLDQEGRINGRMLYGPPACGCNLLEDVEIS
ncbi:hypothetical protein V8F06_011178 [Rhypophila decipiens]